MKTLASILLLLGYSLPNFAQFQQGSYTYFGVSAPLKENVNRDDDDSSWFIPDGLSLKFGEGIHFNRTIAFGLNSGIDWVGSRKLVVIPAYANLKISLQLGQEDFFYIQPAYGKSIVLGRGNLHDDYQKISLGYEGMEGYSFFIELTQYGFKLYTPDKVTTFSLGLAFTSFNKKTRNKTNNTPPN
jgi:hypothetical protein